MSGSQLESRSERLSRKRGERPEPVGDLVGGLLDRLGVTERVERAGVALDWEKLVGPHIARVTVGTRVSGRTLFVEVVSAAWLSELTRAPPSTIQINPAAVVAVAVKIRSCIWPR